MDLQGKSIIVTGASSGIGAATALACAEAGMDVILNARRADRLDAIADRIRETGRQAEIVVGDVADRAMSPALLDAAEEHFGGFHAVYSNAGYGLQRSVADTSEAELREIFEVNFFASVDLIQTAARRLLEAKRPGHLLMCSSCLAKFTLPAYSAYSATKAAQNHICRAMAIEMEPHGVFVSSVHPITTVTEFFEVAVERGGKSKPESGVPDHARWPFVQTPQRVADAIVKCLRKPKPEVWTSHIVRATAAFMTFSPWFADRIMRKSGIADGTTLPEEPRRHGGTERS